jgi:hypothetical protein
MNKPFTINIPISKIDEEQRIVTGIATAEVLDSQGDIIDYEASKKAFASWGGNIREMHGNKAVGKSIDIQFDDTNRQVILSSYISESADGQNAWIKIKEGILTGYSIGGRMLEVVKDKAIDGANRIMNYTLSETSLVDNPACPTALFTMVKSIDGKLQRVEANIESSNKLPDSWWMEKFMSKDIKKDVYGAQEAIEVASTLAYLLMCEQMEDVVDQDQLDLLTTAFTAVKEFVAKEVMEGDDYVTEYATVMEMAQKAIDLQKGKNMKDLEKKGVAVVGGVARDENAATVAAVINGGAPIKKDDEVVETPVVETAEVETTEAPVEEVAEEVIETPADETVETPAEAPVEEVAEVEGEKSNSMADLAKNVETLLAKLNETEGGAELKKVNDSFQKLSDKVEKSLTSLEGRISAIEAQPLPTKGKASFAIITKGEDKVDNTKEELEKRQEAFMANPHAAPKGEAEAIAKGFRELTRGK